MDQIKIGRFIATCRKELGFTQAQIAEELQISDRAVSKWETGKSLPDSSLMLDLCKILKINVNELLTGERIVMENYKDMAENNLIELKKTEEKYNRMMMKLEYILLIVSTFMFLLLCFVASYAQINKTLKTVLVIAGAVMFISAIIICIIIEMKIGYYECPKCGHRYIPDGKAFMWAMHMGTTRRLRCPNCGEKSWQKKVYSK